MLNRRIAGQINNGFGPIFEQRGSRSTYAAIVVIFLYILISYFVERGYGYPRPWYFYEFLVGVSFLVWVLGEVIRRFFLFIEEYHHVESRYDGSCKKALATVFQFINRELILALTAVALFMVAHSFFEGLEWASFTSHDGYLTIFSNVIFMPALVHVFGLNELSSVEFSQVSEKQNKNLADGLAWSYYFGYLKIVLPELDTQIQLTEERSKKLTEQLTKQLGEEFKEQLKAEHDKLFKNKIRKEDRKLFILIPKNCYVKDIISDPSNLVEGVGNLEPLKKNRGGIRERLYRHTVYRIKDENRDGDYHCVLEYATPLKILSEMSNDSTAGLSREEKDYQVVAFYKKVKEILDGDPECKGKYELITVSGGNEDPIGEIMKNTLRNVIDVESN